MRDNNAPIFNLPRVVMMVAALQIAIFLPQTIGLHWLSSQLFDTLAFVPLRYHGRIYLNNNLLATVLSPIGYSLLHIDWVHLVVNLGMMIAFGKVIVQVCGTRVFFVLYALGALAGSSVVLAFAEHPQFPLIGASAAVSAFVGAITCLGIMQHHRMPRPFDSRRRSMQFLAAWVGINILMALLPYAAFASIFAIAWHAHLAGLFVGYIYAHWGLCAARAKHRR